MEFQCRTRLCGWCSEYYQELATGRRCFNAARGFVGGAARSVATRPISQSVSMPHAALWVVQRLDFILDIGQIDGFNAARGFVCGAA